MRYNHSRGCDPAEPLGGFKVSPQGPRLVADDGLKKQLTSGSQKRLDKEKKKEK
jgi:hypothetical protein